MSLRDRLIRRREFYFGQLCKALAGAGGCIVAAACALLLSVSAANGESLRDALIAAYQTNPGLDAERARLRATDENVPRAKSGYRPTVTGQGSIASTGSKSDPASPGDVNLNPTNWQLNVRQPVFDGFRTRNAVNAAEAGVRAGRARLGDREATTLLDAATAYMDVVRDMAILKLRQRNVGVLSEELQAAKERRAVSEVTITDVAQARARRARAVSEADLAKANLRISRANFRRVVGHVAETVVEPPLRVRGLPGSLDEALQIAGQESPRLIAALYQEQEARYAVDRVWGELLPQIDVEANYSHGTDVSRAIDSRSSASITGRLRIPFYQGGAVHARVRQAKHTHVSRLQDIEQARADLEANVTAAWSRLRAARAQLKSDRVQVSAASTALNGVREEEKVGQRTLLEVLNASQELLDAQVSLVATRRDLIVASYGVLASIGRLTVEGIELATDVYVPEAHYEEVRRKWIGVTVTRARQVEQEPIDEGMVEEELAEVVPPPSSPVRRRSRRPLRASLAAPEKPLLERLIRHSFDADSRPPSPPRTMDGYAWKRGGGKSIGGNSGAASGAGVRLRRSAAPTTTGSVGAGVAGREFRSFSD
ncbi:MAG: TolC family outer membrane protein [Alphaproteobacteria bacterium]|nr:TolC family outer membrane protein [Alphaproteobacteria bacterium]